MERLKFILRTLLYGWVQAIGRLIEVGCRICRRCRTRGKGRDHRATRARCVPIDHPVFIRPDPLIYSQHFLMQQGLAVTWNNPDIQLWKDGNPISSYALQADTRYEVVARIWNGSMEAPVIQMPVDLSYLDFGVGTVKVPIGTALTDVGVIGTANNPAFVSLVWRTPKTPGHYCLQVDLKPADDLNFANNLGQENADVGLATSPATFRFTLRNDTGVTHRYRFTHDVYQLPSRFDCEPVDGLDRTRQQHVRQQGKELWPLPEGWSCEVDQAGPTLAPGEQTRVTATITPSDNWSGSRPVNVNAFHEQGLAGGVTLIVERGG